MAGSGPCFEDVSLTFAIGRYQRFQPRLMTHEQVFQGRKA
jgi:hypothetical protein